MPHSWVLGPLLLSRICLPTPLMPLQSGRRSSLAWGLDEGLMGKGVFVTGKHQGKVPLASGYRAAREQYGVLLWCGVCVPIGAHPELGVESLNPLGFLRIIASTSSGEEAELSISEALEKDQRLP